MKLKRDERKRREPLTARGTTTLVGLLKVAEKTFRELGFQNTSVSEICRRAKVSNGTFYQYFTDKADIFHELIAELNRRLQEHMQRAAQSEADPLKRILLIHRAFLSCVQSHTNLYQVFREAEFIREEIPKAFYDGIAKVYIDALLSGVNRGRIRPLDPMVIAYCLIGVAEFLAMRWLIWDKHSLPKAALQSSMEFITYGLDTGIKTVQKPKSRKLESLEADEREAPQTQGEATRNELLKAAEAIFGEQGFYKTSIADITKRAGVAQGTFYLYFPSKVAIFIELVRQINEALRERARQAISDLQDRREIEREGFYAFFHFIKEHKRAYRIVREAEFVDEETGQWYYKRLASSYIKGLQEGMERGQIRALDPEMLAYALMGIGHFMGLKWIVWEGHERVPEKAFEEMMGFIMHGISARLST